MDFKVYPGCLEREAQQAARYGAGRSPAPYRLPYCCRQSRPHGIARTREQLHAVAELVGVTRPDVSRAGIAADGAASCARCTDGAGTARRTRRTGSRSRRSDLGRRSCRDDRGRHCHRRPQLQILEHESNTSGSTRQHLRIRYAIGCLPAIRNVLAHDDLAADCALPHDHVVLTDLGVVGDSPLPVEIGSHGEGERVGRTGCELAAIGILADLLNHNHGLGRRKRACLLVLVDKPRTLLAYWHRLIHGREDLPLLVAEGLQFPYPSPGTNGTGSRRLRYVVVHVVPRLPIKAALDLEAESTGRSCRQLVPLDIERNLEDRDRCLLRLRRHERTNRRRPDPEPSGSPTGVAAVGLAEGVETHHMAPPPRLRCQAVAVGELGPKIAPSHSHSVARLLEPILGVEQLAGVAAAVVGLRHRPRQRGHLDVREERLEGHVDVVDAVVGLELRANVVVQHPAQHLRPTGSGSAAPATPERGLRSRRLGVCRRSGTRTRQREAAEREKDRPDHEGQDAKITQKAHLVYPFL